MLMPYRTLPDLEVQGEGSLDPLGLAGAARSLAEWILPGMTARMWRPRFLTTIAVASLLTQPFFEDEVARDGITPPWLVLEWYFVEAQAARGKGDGSDLRAIPGIDKARRALRDGVPMSAQRYLKTPKVFGFHGVYKRLARHVDIADDDLALGESGFRLLRIWEREQGLDGFSDSEREDGTPARLRRALREAIRDALASGQTERRPTWAGGEFLVAHLTPSTVGTQEAHYIWELLVSPAAEPRGEVFRLLKNLNDYRTLLADRRERSAMARLRHQMSAGLRLRADAIEALESVCRPLQEVWDRLCYLATGLRPTPVRADDMARDARVAEIARGLAGGFSRARPGIAESPALEDFEALARDFEHVETAADLFQALWDRHVAVQRDKPPDGKRPWFEATDDGGLVIRPPYRLDETWVREEYVHPYRLINAARFMDDLLRSV
jgi:hypothetical protein